MTKFGPLVIVSLLIPWTAVHAFVPCTQSQINSNGRCSSLSHSHSIARRIPWPLRCQSTDTTSSIQILTTKLQPQQPPPTADSAEHDPSTSTSSTTSTSTSTSASTVSQMASFGPPPFDLRMNDDSEERNRWIARLILLVVAAFYGTNFGCVKILNDSLEPSVSALRSARTLPQPYLIRSYTNSGPSPIFALHISFHATLYPTNLLPIQFHPIYFPAGSP